MGAASRPEGWLLSDRRTRTCVGRVYVHMRVDVWCGTVGACARAVVCGASAGVARVDTARPDACPH